MGSSFHHTDDFIYPEWPAPDNVKAVMTTRNGGSSHTPFDSMNLGSHVDDLIDDVIQNRQALKNRLSLPAEPLWLNQIHGTTVAPHDQTTLGDDADAIISHASNEVCSIMTADCLPVLFCDTSGSVVAGAHAGWRGLQGGILENCVAAMAKACAKDEILVWLGAAIGPKAFEVGSEVREAFVSVHEESESAFTANQQSKWLADIYQLARIHLVKSGVLAENIYGGGHCTYTETSQFFSYRRESRTGRMASLIWLS